MVASGFNKDIEKALRKLLEICAENVVNCKLLPNEAIEVELNEIRDYSRLNQRYKLQYSDYKKMLTNLLGLLKGLYGMMKKDIEKGMDPKQAFTKERDEFIGYLWKVEKEYKKAKQINL